MNWDFSIIFCALIWNTKSRKALKFFVLTSINNLMFCFLKFFEIECFFLRAANEYHLNMIQKYVPQDNQFRIENNHSSASNVLHKC